MGVIGRLSASISASLDRAVAQIENHDAVIEAAIGECRAGVVKARQRSEQLHRDGQKLSKQLEQANINHGLWQERAKREGRANEARALQCLRRAKACAAERDVLLTQLQQHSELQADVESRLQSVEHALAETVRKRNEMRSRTSVVEAKRSLQNVSMQSATSIEDCFDRWEQQIARKQGADEFEQPRSSQDPIDSLERNYRDAEADLELKAELDALLAQDTEVE